MTSKNETLAKDMALACRFCRTPTDHEFDADDNLWITRCECGKVDYHDVDEVSKDIEYISNALGKIQKR